MWTNAIDISRHGGIRVGVGVGAWALGREVVGGSACSFSATSLCGNSAESESTGASVDAGGCGCYRDASIFPCKHLNTYLCCGVFLGGYEGVGHSTKHPQPHVALAELAYHSRPRACLGVIAPPAESQHGARRDVVRAFGYWCVASLVSCRVSGSRQLYRVAWRRERDRAHLGPRNASIQAIRRQH